MLLTGRQVHRQYIRNNTATVSPSVRDTLGISILVARLTEQHLLIAAEAVQRTEVALQTGNIFLINCSTAASVCLDRCPNRLLSLSVSHLRLSVGLSANVAADSALI